MKYRLSFLFFIIVFTISAQNSSLKSKVETVINEFPDSTVFSIAFINKGQVAYQGFEKIGDSTYEVRNENSVFEIGSITKVFTSTLLAQFVNEGKVELEEYIDKHMGFKLKTKKTFTFKSLSNHTSGLPRLPTNLNYLMNLDEPYKMYDEEKFVNYIKKEMAPIKGSAGNYQYSNLGAGLLAKALCSIEKVTFEELLSKNIFDPLNMTQSTVELSKLKDPIVIGRKADGSSTPFWNFNALEGAGAILSTTKDLSKFVKAQFNEQKNAFNLCKKPTHSINKTIKVGLGWHIFDFDGTLLHWHNGSTGGFSSYLIIDEMKENGVIILTNVSGGHLKRSTIDELGLELLKGLEE